MPTQVKVIAKVHRAYSLQIALDEPQVLNDNVSGFLSNRQGCIIRVCRNIAGRDAQVRNLQAFDAVDIEPFVNHAKLLLAGCHLAGSKTMPLEGIRVSVRCSL